MIKTWVLTKKGNSFEVTLPSIRIVCPSCDGKGTELYGSLKGAAFSSDDFAEDPDFAEAYFGGQYDVTCSECNGRNVIEVVDEDRLTKKMLERYLRAVDEKNKSDAEDAAERRYFERFSS